MAQHQNYFLPLSSLALALNGEFGRGYPFLQDYGYSLDMIMFTPTTYIDTNDVAGSPKNGFIGYFYDNKRIRYDEVLFGNSTYATIAAWQAYFNAIGLNNMTQYLNWIAIGKRSIPNVPAILVNDAKIFRRVYNQNPNTTDLWVDFGNVIRRKLLTLTGDQTIAGGYYYTA